MAQAILHEPDIVILDEPTNGLDPTQILHMRELIRELAATATVIVSTHILQEVQAVCERVLIMRAGRLVVDARMDELQPGRRLLVAWTATPAAALAGIAGVAGRRGRGRANGRWTYALEADAEVAPAGGRRAASRPGFGCTPCSPSGATWKRYLPRSTPIDTGTGGGRMAEVLAIARKESPASSLRPPLSCSSAHFWP